MENDVFHYIALSQDKFDQILIHFNEIRQLTGRVLLDPRLLSGMTVASDSILVTANTPECELILKDLLQLI